MIAKALAGMPTNRAMAWAEDQVKLALQGRLETRGASRRVVLRRGDEAAIGAC
jgi:hypothetical protein